ncbi:MAG TPA: M56 family metallopeptidase [Bryobacteraceae bacterium]
MNALFNHLWQSTIFAVVVAAVVALLQRQSPRLRYWLWLSASAKFLIPFSLIVSTGALVQLPKEAPALRPATVQQISTYFEPISVFPSTTAPAEKPATLNQALIAIWILGALFLLVRWFQHWRTIRHAAGKGVRLNLDYPVPVYSSSVTLEPGVFGIVRPLLLLPDNLAETLSPEQFESILAHESRHIQYRDNLTAALHMLVEMLFWFHPLIWWVGARLTDERERDCDHAVLQEGNQPGEYARGIVSVCQSYVESPLLCAPGISGSDLKKRIREIMAWRGSQPLAGGGKVLLATAACGAVLIPFTVGILRAQTAAGPVAYDVAVIHPTDPAERRSHMGPDGPRGGLRTLNTTTQLLIGAAYHVEDFRVVNAPSWAASDRFDVIITPDRREVVDDSKPEESDRTWNRDLQRLQAVLHDRFHLRMHQEAREMPIYSLTEAKGGNKLSAHSAESAGPSIQMENPGRLTATAVTMDTLAGELSWRLHRPVRNDTRLAGRYDLKIEWTPDHDFPTAPIFGAITQQLGLRLDPAKGAMPVYVVDQLDRPSEN